MQTDDGPALFDCGPASALAALEHGLEQRGLALTDSATCSLSHIHLDHAGAAGALVRRHPALRCTSREVGAPHLVDPTRLSASAAPLRRRASTTSGASSRRFPQGTSTWSATRRSAWRRFPTTGHAATTSATSARTATLYAGDAAGVRIQPDDYVAPPTPPPEFDLEAWNRTIDEIERRAPERLALIHFGVVDESHPHLES